MSEVSFRGIIWTLLIIVVYQNIKTTFSLLQQLFRYKYVGGKMYLNLILRG